MALEGHPYVTILLTMQALKVKERWLHRLSVKAVVAEWLLRKDILLFWWLSL
jgi:hypothetical protein